MGKLTLKSKHRVLCADCTVKENVDRLMNGEKADMVFTDPPYGIDVAGQDGKVGGGILGSRGKNRHLQSIIGDDKEFDPTFCLSLAPIALIFGGNYFTHVLPRATHWLVWDKTFEKEWVRTDMSSAEIIWTNIPRKSTQLYKFGYSGLFRCGTRKDEGERRFHPTQKPVGLISEILYDYSKDGHQVIDPFLGSGSTLIACEKTNRRCFGMEIDPIYIDVIINRYIKFSSRKVVRDDGVLWVS